MLALPLLSLLACEPPAAPAPPPPPTLTGSEGQCVEKHCASADGDAAFASCRAEKCAPRAEAWTVNPTLLRYDDGVVTMSVQVEHTPGGHGDVDAPAPGETWLGATVLTSKGEEIDMAVQTVFPDRLKEPFTFSSQVGPDVQDIIVGLWGKKIEPCDSTRSGCQMFGFVLDQSLAAWPAGTYTESPPRRQRFLPQALTVKVATAGAGASAKPVTDALTEVFAAETQRFGTTFAVNEAPAPTTENAVVHKHANDGPFASMLAARLASVTGAPLPVRHDPTAEADLFVALGAPCTGPDCK